MFGFVGELKRLKFEDKKYRKQLEENLKQLMREAAGEWLRAVMQSVPVDTGMAAGSLQPLARLLESRQVNVGFIIRPRTETGKLPRIAEGAALGEQYPGGDVLEFKSNMHGIFNYQFYWDSKVEHYYMNEFFQMPAQLNLRHVTPWYSTVTGRVAFERHLNTNLRSRIPGLSSYIIATGIFR